MAYKIIESAKNVWIRDNADTMDLSPLTDASSVYLENGRSVEQELGEGSMVSNIVTMDKPMEKVVEGTHDGAFESCVLKGRTLVNHLGIYQFTSTGASYANGTIHFVEGQSSQHCDFTPNVKPNTVYTAVFFLSKPIPVNRSLAIGCLDNGAWTGQNYYKGGDGVSTFLKIRISSGNTNQKIRVRYDLSSSIQGTDTPVSMQVVLLEGDWRNQEIPFNNGFEGMCDVKSPVIKSAGKNLFDYSISNIYTTSASEKYQPTLNEDGSVTVNSCYDNPYWLKNGFYIEKGKQYTVTVTGKKSGDYSALCFGFDNLRYLDGGAGKALIPVQTSGNCIDTVDKYGTKTMTCTALETGYVTRFYIHGSGLVSRYTILEFQIEESSIPSSYEPYRVNTIQTPEEIVLREVGGVCDTYNVLTGEYVQRIGEIVLDGSEVNDGNGNKVWIAKYSINTDPIYNTTDKTSVFCLNDIPNKKLGYGTSICDKFTNCHNADAFTMSSVRKGIYSDHTTLNRMYFDYGDNNNYTVHDFLEYLSQNHVTIQYELAEPVVTIIEPNTIPFVYENGHIILSSGYEGQSLLPVLEYSTVVGRRGQIQSIAKMTRRHEEKLTMLEQMLVTNILAMDYENTLLALNLEMDEVM